MTEDSPNFPRVRVECYAGHCAEETPRRFWLAGAAIEIAEIVDSWLAPEHRYFKVQDAGGDQYILRHDVNADFWELTWYHRGTSRGEDPG